MKRIGKIIVCLIVITLVGAALFSACDLLRKVQGAEVKFRNKVTKAEKLAFDMHLEIKNADSESELDVGCYKSGEEYAYTFSKPNNANLRYRRLFADECLYEYAYQANLGIGTYYTNRDVAYTDDRNLLYAITENIMLATYATLLTEGKKDTVAGKDAYRYDFSYGGNQYSLWYDDENLVKISATFYSTDEEGQSTSETYLATFSNYRFGETERDPFLRPQESTEAIYAESPISFEDWMTILDRFSSRAASWLG